MISRDCAQVTFFEPFVKLAGVSVRVAALLFVLLHVLHGGCALAEDDSQNPAETNFRCRLVNVTIPADSPLRNPSSEQSFDRPPDLYVILKKNGSPLSSVSGKASGSTWHTGWSVDFPREDQNMWELSVATADRYSIEIWDYDRWSSDELVLSITGLKGSEFRGSIYEQGGKNVPKDRLVTIEFEEIEAQ